MLCTCVCHVMSCEYPLTHHVMAIMSCDISYQHYVIDIQMYYVMYTTCVYATSTTWAVYVVYILHVIRVHTHVNTLHITCVDICPHISCHVYRDTYTWYLCMCMCIRTYHVTQVVLHVVYMYCTCTQ